MEKKVALFQKIFQIFLFNCKVTMEMPGPVIVLRGTRPGWINYFDL